MERRSRKMRDSPVTLHENYQDAHDEGIPCCVRLEARAGSQSVPRNALRLETGVPADPGATHDNPVDELA